MQTIEGIYGQIEHQVNLKHKPNFAELVEHLHEYMNIEKYSERQAQKLVTYLHAMHFSNTQVQNINLIKIDQNKILSNKCLAKYA